MNIGGPSFLLFAFSPIIALMFVTGDFSPVIGSNLWVSIGIAFAVGVGAGITVLGSGISGVSVMMAFILAFATTLYAIMTLNSLNIILGLPFNGGAIIEGFSAFFFVLGVFFMTASPHSTSN